MHPTPSGTPPWSEKDSAAEERKVSPRRHGPPKPTPDKEIKDWRKRNQQRRRNHKRDETLKRRMAEEVSKEPAKRGRSTKLAKRRRK